MQLFGASPEQVQPSEPNQEILRVTNELLQEIIASNTEVNGKQSDYELAA